MRKLVFIMLVFVAVGSGCSKKNQEFQDSGTLAGVDMAQCPCCGGVVLQIDNKTGNYRIDSLPGISQHDFDNLSYPKLIHFNWQLNGGCGSIQFIKITSFQFY
jgi:hypothetical protein